MGYNFEWDPGKAQANRKKHGVPFEEAVTVFGDPLSMKMPDPDHSESEQRISSLGYPNDIDFWLFATLKLKKKRESSARVNPRVLNERAMKKGKTKSSQGASPLEISSIGEGTTSVVP